MRAFLRLLLLLLIASGAHAAPQDQAQQKCIQGFEKSAAKLSKASGRLALKCLKNGAKKGESVSACLQTDPTGKQRSAEEKLGGSEQKLCADATPEFGTSDAGLASDGIVASRDAWLRDLLTPDLDGGTAVEPVAARCQAEATKRIGKLQEAHWKGALAGAKAALKDGAASGGQFEDAILARLLADPKIERAESKLRDKVSARCDGVEFGDVVPGLCFFAVDVPGCMAASAACEFCSAWNSTTDGTLDCELYDDGEANGSCQNAAGGPALYVATAGTDAAEGTREAPLATLAEALSRAQGGGVGSIRMAAGIYPTEPSNLVDGISIFGGFDPQTWGRDGGETVLSGTEPLVLTANGLQFPTTLADLTIEAANAEDGSGEGSYAVSAFDTSSLRIRDSILRAGTGGDGARGADGIDRGNADDGDDGRSCDDGNCNSPLSGGAGGSGSCSDSAGGGGPGGTGGDIPTPLLFDGNGQDGFDSADGASGGGDGGDECFAIWPSTCSAGTGGRGDDGDDGSVVSGTGPGGSGDGTATAVGWFGVNGGQGRPGESGSGGGGGGGGGGKAQQPLITLEAGVGGGGGGAGGCGGGAGSGGGAGGGSFALYAYQADVTVEDSTLESRSGGDGGDGGLGGDGGNGGTGGDGGESDDGGDGGRGGNGGDGSNGTSGGGGAGGISFAAYVSEGSLTQLGDNLLLSGDGGSGGNPGGGSGDSGLVGP
ncbi:MAG: DUF1565 domain-containing protein [Myxococcales bacterium]|nr:DUF1565 domain-containing protein [Myxococcales bacterium]